MAKTNTNKVALKPGPAAASPIRDIMATEPRDCVTLSDQDIEYIQRLAQTPPPASPKLVKDLQQHVQSRKVMFRST